MGDIGDFSDIKEKDFSNIGISNTNASTGASMGVGYYNRNYRPKEFQEEFSDLSSIIGGYYRGRIGGGN